MKIRTAMFALVLSIAGSAQAQPAHTREAYEAYYLRIGSYPYEERNDWNPDGVETQGVTHDANHWFFTGTRTDQSNGRLWRIPVQYALDQDVAGLPGVSSITMRDVPQLSQGDYWHFGDPDHYRTGGVDYILVPVHDGSDGGAASTIAVFASGAGLSFVTHAPLPQVPEIGWLAITPEGDLVTSEKHASHLTRFRVGWSALQGSPPTLPLTWAGTHPLRDGAGAGTTLYHMQGGDFTPSGELLYIASGSGDCKGFGNGIYASDGLHVFDTETWQEVVRSRNGERLEGDGQALGPPYFDFGFLNSCSCGSGSETPEGLTIWDLDDGRAPNIRGQLHAVVNHYMKYALCGDSIDFQHFGSRIHVDGEAGSAPTWSRPFPGNASRPFATVRESTEWYPVWDGAEIVIRAGSYADVPERWVAHQRIRMTSQGGAASIETPASP